MKKRTLLQMQLDEDGDWLKWQEATDDEMDDVFFRSESRSESNLVS